MGCNNDLSLITPGLLGEQIDQLTLSRRVKCCINFINEQVSAFEQRRIEEKRLQINELYQDCLGDMQKEL